MEFDNSTLIVFRNLSILFSCKYYVPIITLARLFNYDIIIDWKLDDARRWINRVKWIDEKHDFASSHRNDLNLKGWTNPIKYR